jgi:hypothetical protein
MKHPSCREFFAYWDEKRGGARAPDRSEIEPSAVNCSATSSYCPMTPHQATRFGSPARAFAPWLAAI